MTDTKAPVTDIQAAVLKWTKNRLLLDAKYYPDRKPNRGHLSSKILERIYDGLKEDVGDIQATNFVSLIYYLEDMTTSVFVEAFKKFWKNGCLVLPDYAEDLADDLDPDEEKKCLDIKKLALVIAIPPRTDFSRAEITEESLVLKGAFLAHHKDEVVLGLSLTQ